MMLFFENNKIKSSSSQNVIHYPSKELTLTWRDISYEVKTMDNDNNYYLKVLFGNNNHQYTKVLQGVNGIVKSGELMAIMGPSGAGKTTLLATISRKIKDETVGDVFLNGEPVDQEIMSRMSGFVPQEDLSIDTLTVQEHMEFMARMTMDRRFKTILRKQRITVLLTDLGLVKCRNSRLSALSGGERKRVSLAVQLLTEPRVLFCDEPTSGLDSYAAMTVVKTLREVAERGKIVICSIHQPASGILDLFHQVLLLSTGRVAFQGNSADATKFFESLDLHCPPTFNSADFFLSQLSVKCGSEEDSYKKTSWICDEFEKSQYGKNVSKLIEDSCSNTSKAEIVHTSFLNDCVSTLEFKKVRCLTQLEWLTWRIYIDYKRNLSVLIVRFLLYMFIGILLATPYIAVADDLDQRGIQNMQGLIYLVITETVFTFNYAVFYTFPRELPLLLRDIASGLYNPAPYYFSKVVFSIPGTIFQTLAYSTLIYVVVGLNGGFSGFILFTIPVALSAISASATGFLMSSAFKSFETASLLAVPIDFLGLIFSGIYVQLGSLPAYLTWLKYVSQFYYGTEAVSLTQWREINHIACPPDPNEPCISTGSGVLDKYGYIIGHYHLDCIGLLTIFVVCHLGGFLAILRRSREEPIY
ncbi:protein scarlet-like isoform X2 [Leptopilina heterotoma]|uniref:protein scarlet-like isoform X2 n=1 Tax=Leptopilina heterotoma TaxID=63436 RepID=UPI001CA94D0F|nr:protein scarlet-like isoform X2 [Leptopilina heterotoma]